MDVQSGAEWKMTTELEAGCRLVWGFRSDFTRQQKSTAFP